MGPVALPVRHRSRQPLSIRAGHDALLAIPARQAIRARCKRCRDESARRCAGKCGDPGSGGEYEPFGIGMGPGRRACKGIGGWAVKNGGSNRICEVWHFQVRVLSLRCCDRLRQACASVTAKPKATTPGWEPEDWTQRDSVGLRGT